MSEALPEEERTEVGLEISVGLGWIRALERKIQRKSVNGNHPLTGRGGYFLMYFHNFDIFRARNRENMHISWPGYLRLAVKADGISLKTLHLA